MIKLQKKAIRAHQGFVPDPQLMTRTHHRLVKRIVGCHKNINHARLTNHHIQEPRTRSFIGQSFATRHSETKQNRANGLVPRPACGATAKLTNDLPIAQGPPAVRRKGAFPAGLRQKKHEKKETRPGVRTRRGPSLRGHDKNNSRPPSCPKRFPGQRNLRTAGWGPKQTKAALKQKKYRAQQPPNLREPNDKQTPSNWLKRKKKKANRTGPLGLPRSTAHNANPTLLCQTQLVLP
jgi:hypothetical protein